jgi:hypothetical protein
MRPRFCTSRDCHASIKDLQIRRFQTSGRPRFTRERAVVRNHQRPWKTCKSTSFCSRSARSLAWGWDSRSRDYSAHSVAPSLGRGGLSGTGIGRRPAILRELPSAPSATQPCIAAAWRPLVRNQLPARNPGLCCRRGHRTRSRNVRGSAPARPGLEQARYFMTIVGSDRSGSTVAACWARVVACQYRRSGGGCCPAVGSGGVTGCAGCVAATREGEKPACGQQSAGLAVASPRSPSLWVLDAQEPCDSG